MPSGLLFNKETKLFLNDWNCDWAAGIGPVTGQLELDDWSEWSCFGAVDLEIGKSFGNSSLMRNLRASTKKNHHVDWLIFQSVLA